MRKVVLMLLLATVPALLFAQTPDNFTIEGKVGNLNTPARAYLVYKFGGKDITDSTAVVNGEFRFHGYVSEPISAFVVIDPHAVGINKLKQSRERVDALDLFLEKANMVLTPADSVFKAQVTGSKLNDDNKRFKAVLAPFTDRARAISVEYKSAPEAQQINPAFQDTIAAKYKVVQDAETAALKKFVTENPQSYMSLVALQILVKSGMDIAATETYFTNLAAYLKETELGAGFAGVLKELKVTAIGSPAPDFTQNDVNGTPVTLSSLKGKYVLLDFWASWCGPCRQENPHVVRVYDHYKSKNFTILGVSLDKAEEKALWLKAIQDDGLEWTQVSDLKYWINDVAVLYKVSFIPQNFLIDPTGKIIAKNLKGTDLDSKLAEIFKM